MGHNLLVIKLVDKILEKNKGMHFLEALDIARYEIIKMNLFNREDKKHE